MPDEGRGVPADSSGNLQIIGFQANTCLIGLDRSKIRYLALEIHDTQRSVMYVYKGQPNFVV